jgi:hypothetical protein
VHVNVCGVFPSGNQTLSPHGDHREACGFACSRAMMVALAGAGLWAKRQTFFSKSACLLETN